jgi:hypothetical protein
MNQPNRKFAIDWKVLLLLTVICSFFTLVQGQNSRIDPVAAKPLFRDPVCDGAADPVVIWNAQKKRWFMLYTNRRANSSDANGVSWVHGTRIGIAESTDGGCSWRYRDTCDIQYRYRYAKVKTS